MGRYLPADTRPGGELAAYARWCTAVEANTTFYAVPSRDTTRRWAEAVDPAFRFVCKLPREISHDRRLRDVGAPLAELLGALEPLGERLGPLWVQLPASFGPEELPSLDAFLRAAGDERRWVVEVRHRTLADGGDHDRALNELLHRHGADRVVFDTRALFSGPRQTPAEVEAFERKPRLPVRPVALGRHPVVRFLGRTDDAANPDYWAPWIAKLAAWLAEGREPYWFMHTPDNATSPAQARAVHAAVAAIVPDLAPLPDPPAPPEQLQLC